MRFCDLFKSKAEERVEEAVNVVEERTQHFRKHIHNINERLNLIEKRIDRLIEALERK
jgi:prefoldin subunit 5